jgi:glycosyltransferase involved in cell wall biosynthesis
LWHLLAQRFCSPGRIFLVADFEPSPEQLRERLGGVPAWMALPVPPQQPLPQVRYVTIATGTNPIDFGNALQKARRSGVDVVAFWLPWSEIRGQTLLCLARSGLRWGWFLRGPWRLMLPLWCLVLWRGILSWWQKRRGLATEQEPTTEQMVWLQEAPGLTSMIETFAQAPRSLRIGHFIRTWMFGGVERQLALLAAMQQQAGHEVRLFLQTAPKREPDGSLRWLPPRIPAQPIATHLAMKLCSGDFPENILATLPEDLRGMVLDLAGELKRFPVDVLHCWIDEANIVGLLAARVAAVPAVVMHVLGVSPQHWPLGHKPWMRGWYRAGLQRENLALVCISDAGRQDYAEWLDLPRERLARIPIAFPPPTLPTPEALQRVRHELGMDAERPMVIGVFRLDPEKRPLFFLQVIQRLRELVPTVQVLHAGGGGLGPAFRAEIERLGLQDVVRPLGQPADVLSLIAASDVFLMVSAAEGTPNVSLEAQYLGCVPVLTDVGGCRETMLPGETGLVFPKDDLESIAQGVASLLSDRPRRQVMAKAGRAFVAERFAPEIFLRESTALYQRLLHNHAAPQRQAG